MSDIDSVDIRAGKPRRDMEAMATFAVGSASLTDTDIILLVLQFHTLKYKQSYNCAHLDRMHTFHVPGELQPTFQHPKRYAHCFL